MNTIKVIAAFGVAVPMEDKPRSYITDAESVEVVDSTYYQRRIADGDLELVSDTVPDPGQVEDSAPLPAGDGAKKTAKRAAANTTGE